MRKPFFTICIALMAAPAAAGDRSDFYGTWGTVKQCSGAPIKPDGSVLAEPFVISSGWLKHGRFWCRLNWGPVETRKNGVFSAANAMCGEDAVRGYLLGMILSGEGLTLRWDFPVSNGPLQRC